MGVLPRKLNELAKTADSALGERLDGLVVRRHRRRTDVAAHFRLRWKEVTREHLPLVEAPAGAGEVDVQVVRTVPERIYRALPRGDFRILESYLRALRWRSGSCTS